MKPLTEKQKTALEVIKRYVRRHKWAPARSDIAAAMGIQGAQGVQGHLNALVRRGLLEMGDTPRSLRVVEPDEVPLIDASAGLALGEPLIAEERRLDYIAGSIADAFNPRPTCFLAASALTQVKGMNEGEFVAVRIGSEGREGEVVVIRMDETISLRRLHRRDEEVVELHPVHAHSGEKAIKIPKIALAAYIEGIVVGTLVAKPITGAGGDRQG